MIERQFLGEITFKIDGFDTSVLASKLCKECKVISIYRRADSVFFSTYGKYERKVKDLVSKNGAVCEIISRKGAVYTVGKYVKRWGIPIGIFICTLAIFFLSNTVMKIEINGTDDPEICSEITGILREEGLKPGSYIPSLNYLRLSEILFSHSDSVAWASIGNTGSVVSVNVSVSTNKQKNPSNRIPCNIVASKDAVVKNAVVRVGKLCVLLGDTVRKGQLLVTGIAEREDGNVKYYHSLAEITGQYEEEISLFQPYFEEITTEGEPLYRRCLKFFDFEIPLPGEVIPQGREYSQKSQENDVKLMDFTLPFSVKTYQLTPITRETHEYTRGEALMILYKRLKNYEKNMLAGTKIISRNITETESEEGVSLAVEYVLEGEIGEVREIFIK